MDASNASVALNLLALLGAAAYVFAQTRAPGASPVDIRMASLFAALMVLVGVRAARWGFDVEALRRIEEALAASIPLFALVLAEGLMRRHAPGWLKRGVVLAALAFMLAGLLRPTAAAPMFAWLLGGWVAVSLAGVAALLALRDRASLSRGENSAISAMSVGLLLALPLVASDFLAAAGVSPIRAGGLGLLVFIFAVARVTAYGGGGLGVLRELFWTVAAAGLGLLVFLFVFGWPRSMDLLLWFVLILALVLVFRIVQYLREQSQARSRASFWRAFAEAPTDTIDAFLDRMLAAPELEQAHVVEGAKLAGYDTAALARVFAAAPVLSAEDARGVRDGALEQMGVLFDEHEATHAILIGETPLRLLFVNLPRIGSGPEIGLQLRLFAKLARQAGAP
ncbi:MAG: hypothetical protein AB7O98_15435 [Hyphomonadaceae bacterium]